MQSILDETASKTIFTKLPAPVVKRCQNSRMKIKTIRRIRKQTHNLLSKIWGGEGECQNNF